MRALVLEPGQRDSLRLLNVPDPAPLGPGEVLVEVIEVGLDGTDYALPTGERGRPPDGECDLILGHESLGRVSAVGSSVSGLRQGDLVAATVRRPCPERCPPCASGQVDLCSTGRYVERGILRAHGFASEFYAERAEWLVPLPRSLANVGVLTEPLSITVKGIERAYAFQSGFDWQPRTALVIGAGSLGLLAGFVLRDRALHVTFVDKGDVASDKAQLARRMGADYVRADGRMLDALLNRARFDLVFEATGVSSLIIQAMCLLGMNGVLCVAGLPEGRQQLNVPADCIGLEMVLENRIFFGTVSSNVGHFRRAVELLHRIEAHMPGALSSIITARYVIDDYTTAFDSAVIKNVLTFTPIT